MNIVEYFIRRHVKRQYHNAIERIAELEELIDVWKSMKQAGEGNSIPYRLVENLGNWRSERAKLLVRKARLEKKLKIEKIAEREV